MLENNGRILEENIEKLLKMFVKILSGMDHRGN